MTESVDATAVPPGTVTRCDGYALGNNGEYFAVSRRCRHLGADLSNGSVDADGTLVCPWHASKYDVKTGRMVRGPQGVFAKIPRLASGFMALTRVLPLHRRTVEERDGKLHLG